MAYRRNGKAEKKRIVEVVNKSKLSQLIISICICVASVFMLFFIPGSFHQVDAGEVAVVKIWGDAREVRTAGIHFDLWISHKYEIYDCKVQQVPVKTSAYSSDSQPMDIELYVQYQIQQENAMQIAKNYGGLEMLQSRIETVAIERAKAVLSQYKAEELIKNRQEMSKSVSDKVSEAITSDYYVNITTVVLTNIDFSDAFEKSVEEKMIAEQEKLKAEYENEKAVAKAEADLKVAEAEAKAILAKAEQEAAATEALAQAEANALKLIDEVWKQMTPEVQEAMIKKLAIEKWNGELPDTMVGDEFLQWLMGSLTSSTNP